MAMAPSLLSFSFFFLLTCFSFNAYSSSASPIYYKGQCASIVPEANVRSQSSSFVSVGHQLQTAYFNGADRVLGANPYSQQNSIFVQLERFGETDVSGVFQVSGSISITRTSLFYVVRSSYYRPRRSSVTIMLDGFWSASTGKLCMVGSGNAGSTRGDRDSVDPGVVLKLNNVFNSSNISSVVSGSLDRLKNGWFDFQTFPVLMILQLNYEFTLDYEESKNEFSHAGNDDADKGLPKNNLNNNLFCSSRVSAAIRKLKLEYSGDCNTPKTCTPFSGIAGFLPNFISLNLIECTFTENNQLRILINFGNHGYEDSGTNDFNPETTLVGEGWWDEKKNHLNVLACHFLGLAPNSSFSGVHVGDCSVRLELRFPSIWSITDTSTVVGQIWSNKTVKDPHFFKAITFRKDDDQNVADVQGLKYEYTQQDRVKSLCPRSNANNKGRIYPNPYYHDMKFHMSVRDSNKKIALGHSSPLSVGDQFYELVLSTERAYVSPCVARDESILQVI